MNYRNPDEHGYYGEFGGAFIPEMLYPNVEELQKNYLEIIESEDFQQEYQDLLKNYVGRATPLYFAKNLSRKYNTKIYLKEKISTTPERIKSITLWDRFCWQNVLEKTESLPKPEPDNTALPPLQPARFWDWNALFTWAKSISRDRLPMSQE
jgi:hypothetical protein